MPFDSRRYFYLSQRLPGEARTRRIYLGRGVRAEEAARQIERRKQARQDAREAWLREQGETASAEELLAEMGRLADLLVRGALVAAGYYQHNRGEWRRRRLHARDGNRTADDAEDAEDVGEQPDKLAD